MREQIDELKEKVDIVEVISQYVELQGSGGTYKGFCPFHANTRTPSFTVFKDNNNWYCFGCEEGGDVIHFIELIEGLDFVTATRKLAKEYNVPVFTNPRELEKLRKVAKIIEINNYIAKIWHTNLVWKSPEIMKYLTDERHLTLASIEEFQIGYALDEWTDAMTILGRQGYTREEIYNAGIIKTTQQSKTYDFFRDRIMLPIRTNGDILGFGGRVTPGSDHPAKFINTRNTVAFNKSNTLYGLGQAKKRIRETGTAIIVEGYFDVIAMHQEDFKNTVSVMGTAITEHHIETLRRMGAEKIILVMDGDVAGEKASVTAARKNLGNIYICSLPSGKDPDEIVLPKWQTDGRNSMYMYLQKAKPQISYLIEHYSRGSEEGPVRPKMDTIQKGQLTKRILPLIHKIDNQTEQAAYLEELANALDIKNFRPNPVCEHCGKPHYTTEEQNKFYGK